MQILFVYFFVNVFIAFVVIYNLKLYDCQVYTQTKKCNDKNNRTATTTTMTRWWRRLNLRTVAKFDVINFYQNEKNIYCSLWQAVQQATTQDSRVLRVVL